MLTLINLLCLVILCVYAQTQNIVLGIISCAYLTLCTLGCISVSLSETDSKNIQWDGWTAFIASLIICGTVSYFTFGSSIGLWYLGISVFWNVVTLTTKNNGE